MDLSKYGKNGNNTILCILWEESSCAWEVGVYQERLYILGFDNRICKERQDSDVGIWDQF